MFVLMQQHDLFPSPYQPVAEDEVARVLTAAISRGGRLPRTADLHLSTICAEHLLDELNLAGLAVVKRPGRRLCE
jgi:hypothetical protein